MTGSVQELPTGFLTAEIASSLVASVSTQARRFKIRELSASAILSEWKQNNSIL